MGKVANFLIVAVIFQVALMLFAGQYSGLADPGADTNSTMSITNLVVNPQNWLSNPFLEYLNAALFAFGIAAVVAGLYFIRNEWIVYAGIGGVFLSFGISVYNFWQYMSGQNLWSGADNIIITLLMLPVFVFFVITVLDFTRGKD